MRIYATESQFAPAGTNKWFGSQSNTYYLEHQHEKQKKIHFCYKNLKNIKKNNFIMWSPTRKERERARKILEKIFSKNFPTLEIRYPDTRNT